MKIIISKKGWLKQKYQVNVVADNGRNLLTSEKYYNEQDAEDLVTLCKKEFAGAKVVYTYLKVAA